MKTEEALKIIENHVHNATDGTGSFDAKKTLMDMGMDSLDRVELEMAFEEECAIEITPTESDQSMGIGQTAEAVAAFIAGKTGG